MRASFRWMLAPALALVATVVSADVHTFKIEQIFSNSSGTVQFVVLHEAQGMNSENYWTGHALTSTHLGTTQAYTFKSNLPGAACGYYDYGCEVGGTADSRVLVATQGFADLHLITPDFVVPNGFLAVNGGNINYAGVDQVTYGALPTDGVTAMDRNGTTIRNLATNFAGASASVTGQVPSAGQLQMPGPITYGPQTVGAQSSPVDVTVANIGGTTVTLSGVVSSNPAEFAIVTTTCAGNLAAGGDCEISVVFQPSATGERSGTITMTSSGIGSPQSFAVSGTGGTYSRNYVQKAYVAYYGRPADPSGQSYWAGRMDAEGQSLNAIIGAFGYSDEFNRRYGGLSYTQLVTKIYQQTLARNPDQAGLDYYVSELQAGRRTLQAITLDVLNGATTAPDSTVVANKLDVAAYYSAKVASGCAYGTEQDGVNAVSNVTANPAMVTAAKATIDSRCGP